MHGASRRGIPSRASQLIHCTIVLSSWDSCFINIRALQAGSSWEGEALKEIQWTEARAEQQGFSCLFVALVTRTPPDTN